jgi:methionine synthase II (cobalamin-independent)
MLRIIIGYLRENADVLIGIHCCGNTDWAMILETGLDIVNFDAFDYMDHFLLYEDDIVRFIEGGGAVAWGIVPTSGFRGDESVDELLSRLEEGFRRLHQWGLNADLIARRSILTPACGMGTMTPDAAWKAMNLLSRLCRRCREGDINAIS